MKYKFFPFAITLGISAPAMCSGLFVGIAQTELTTFAGQQPLDFEPSGMSLLGILDLTEAVSVSLDYSNTDDDFQNGPLFSDYEQSTLGGSVSYRFDAWSVAIAFAHTQESIDSLTLSGPPRALNQDIDSDYVGITSDYAWFGGDWQWIAAAGLHYNDWDQADRTLEAGGNRRQFDETGDSTFASINVSGSRFWPCKSIKGVAAGFGLGWNHRLSGGSSLVAINGRSINQLSSRLTPRQTQQLTNQLRAAGGESYGQAFAFVSIEFTEHWLLDLSIGTDIGSDQDTQNTLLTLGYVF